MGTARSVLQFPFTWVLWEAAWAPGQHIELLNSAVDGAARRAPSGDILCGPKGILQLYFQVACLAICSEGLSPLQRTSSVSVRHHDLCKTRWVLVMKFVLMFPQKLSPVFFYFFFFFSKPRSPFNHWRFWWFCRVQTKPDIQFESLITACLFLFVLVSLCWYMKVTCIAIKSCFTQ